MIEQFKRRFNSLYWHQFALTAGMVLLTLLLLGVSFFTLSYYTLSLHDALPINRKSVV